MEQVSHDSRTRRLLAWWRSSRATRIIACAFAALCLASSIWFFAASDDRGKTARLTADAWYYHAYVPSMVFDRDVDFTNEYKITKNWYRFGNTPLGKPANVFGIGPAVFELPFFAVGHGFARISGRDANGFSSPEVKATMFASLCYSLAALLLAGRLVRRRFPGAYLPALVPLLVAAAGPVVYYAVRQPGYGHPFATFWVAWLIDRWDASFDESPEPRSMRTWLALGALLGAAALARPQLALWAVILGVAVVDDVRRARRQGDTLIDALKKAAPRWAAGAAVSVLLILPQLLAWKALYGAFYLVPQGEGFMRWDSPAWSETLFSSRNGLFPWSPLYALCAIGLLVAVRRRARLAGALLVGFALQVIANSAAWDWWAGGSFGGRRFDSCFVAMCVGLAAVVCIGGSDDRPRWHVRLRISWIAATTLLAAVLAIGNVQWASKVSAPSARIHGGVPASQILRSSIRGPFGFVTASASRMSNFPARAVFALRHGTNLDAYDYLVGAHYLGELFPGLNSFRGKMTDKVHLAPVHRGSSGFTWGVRPAVVLEGTTGRAWLGLNRRGPVKLILRVQSAAAGATIVLRANGREIGRGQSTGAAITVEGTVEDAHRGTNWVEIEAPAGTVLSSLTVTVPPHAQ